ncbi:isoamylase early set domain-containing protein [Alteromonas facilis]|uniref:isoamylase early set domain-containing protein n=1 Tax=Alteromonas facilis TaxID=2048004 RepID=UPI000C28A05C|nr:isoamylase early set domain-containing protein [Alteromonas facilis]
MSIKKQFLKSKPVCKVTFKVSKAEAKAADTVRLVGEFNDWDTSVEPMKKLKDGSFTQTLNLETNKAHQFRYLLNDAEWENDWNADSYVPSQFGFDDNSVVAL